MFAKKNVKNIYALTPMQEAMLFQALYDSSSSAHFEQSFYHISGKLDVQIFEAAWNEIVRRHDILRTIFVHKDVPRPLQIVLKKRSIDFNFKDISSLSKKEQDAYFEKQKEEDWLKPFVLSKDVLMRVSLFQTGDRSFNVLWSFHHILMDGWSNNIIYNEFYQIYNDLSIGIKPGLSPTVPFALYIRWLKEQDKDAAKLYWREYLSAYNQPVGLPRKIVEEQTEYHAKTFCFELDEAVTAELQKTASKNHVGFNTVIQTMWGILLGQYNDLDDTVFGAVVSGRPAEIKGIENMVGLLINLIPVRIQFDPLQSFKDIMLKVHDDSIKSKAFHHCSLASIQAETNLKQNLLDHVLVFENYPMEESATKTANGKNEKQDDTFIIDQFEHADHTNYDLNIQIAPGKKLLFRIIYNSSAYDSAIIKNIEIHLSKIIEAVLENDEIKINEIKIFESDEKDRYKDAAVKRQIYVPDKPEEQKRSTAESAPAENDNHKKLIDIWEEILDIENIGIDDDYIDLGGHSIAAIRIISRIHKVFEVELGLKEFFDYPTIRNLNLLIEKADFIKFEDIKPLDHQPHYEVSHAQKRLWILDNLEDNYTAYNLSGGYLFEGRLDQNAFNLAFKTIVLRHESFRTSFVNIDGSLRQKINPDTNFAVEVINLQQSENYLKAAEKIATDEASYPFDLEKDDLIRVKLLKLSENRHILIITIHHIVFDGWSFGVLENELTALYNAFVRKQSFQLPDLRIQYKEYSAWQNKILKSEKIDRHKTFWHNELNGLLPVINLPTDHPRPAVFSFKGKTVAFVIDSTLSTGIKTLARDNSVSLFMTLAAALKALIYRYTGQNDIIIGTPIAGRNHPDLENQIGFYVNTLALRDEIKGEETFNTLLSKVKQTTTMAYEHQIYPFDRLVQELDIQRDVSRSPVFDVMLVLQNNSDSHNLPDDLKISSFNFETGISQFDLTFEFAEIEDRLALNINYNTDLFEQKTVKRIESHFEELMKSAAKNAGKCQIRNLNILSEAEKKLVLIDFNDTKTSYPADKTIIDIFEEQVKLTPDNIAVIFEDKCLSYKELNELADTMAFSLRKNYRIEPDDIVGVITHRNEQMIISLLGIMKAGGAYLPIDPEYPQKRIDYMIKDSGCKVVLSSDENFDSGAGSQETEPADFQFCDSSLKTADSANLAYVIYTSGSTGQPKGVMIEHGGFVNMITAQISGFNVNEKDRVLQFASPSFDASLSEIFMALLKGAAIVLIKKDTINDKDAFLQYIEKFNVSVITFPPVYLKMLERHPLPTVKTIITAGEPAIKSDALFYSKNKIYFNAFGPTEASVCTSFHKVDHKSLMNTNKSLIPIGGPIANSSIYIIDNAFNPVPIGLSGEICFSGPGLSRGYLNRSKLTEEKFIDNPFVPGERLYKTGDRGRWLLDGNIEFEGRKDDQQKIRGHRVEPGEIQGTLIEHLDVKDALVLVRKSITGENELVSYVITENSRVLNAADLRLYLNKILPSYMIPAFFVFLEKFPMTVNGKIDKKALPHHLENTDIGIEYAAPRNEIEEKIASIWQKFFDKEKIGIHNNFFDMGGDSIRAIQMVSYLHQENLRVKAKEILMHPTIALLSDILSSRLSEKKVQDFDITGSFSSGHLDQKPVTGIVPLTAVSSWFFKEYKYDRHHFNHVSMFHSKNRYDENGLRAVFVKLQEHHDIFRTRYEFKRRDGHETITQYNCGLDYPLDFTIFDLTDIDSDMAIEKLRRNTEMLQTEIDLENGPLMKIALFRMSDGDRLLVIIHHLIFDRISWSIFIEDLNLGYDLYLSGKAINLPIRTDSFKKWAEHIELYGISDALMKEKPYWQSLESDFVSGIESGRIKALPYDSTIEKGLMADIVHASISLSISETEELLARADRIYHAKIDEILLTALAYAMNKWHGCNTTLITLEGHGREDIIEGIDVSRTIGWFTSTWPVILELLNTESATENRDSEVWDAASWIEKIKSTVKSIPNKGIGYGILKYLTPLEYKNDLKFCLNPEINFNYLGQFKEEDAGFFEIAEDSPPIHSYSPNAEIIHNLDIAAMIVDRKLHINFAYNSKCFKEKTIDRILTDYHIFLKGIAIS